MNPNYRNFALWAIIALLLIALFNLFQSPGQRTNSREISYSQFIDDISNGRVKAVTITGDRIAGTYSDSGAAFQTYSPGDTGLVPRLESKGVTITARPESDGSSSLVSILLSWLPMILILGVWIFFRLERLAVVMGESAKQTAIAFCKENRNLDFTPATDGNRPSDRLVGHGGWCQQRQKAECKESHCVLRSGNCVATPQTPGTG